MDVWKDQFISCRVHYLVFHSQSCIIKAITGALINRISAALFGSFVKHVIWICYCHSLIFTKTHFPDGGSVLNPMIQICPMSTHSDGSGLGSVGSMHVCPSPEGRSEKLCIRTNWVQAYKSWWAASDSSFLFMGLINTANLPHLRHRPFMTTNSSLTHVNS